MRFRTIPAGLLVLLAVSAAFGIGREYVTGQILDVQQRYRDRVLLYQVNTPIMTEDPYVTITVSVHGADYVGEFLPRHHQEMFPSFWQADEPVQVRIDKHFLYLKREDGSEAKFLILSKSQARPAGESN